LGFVRLLCPAYNPSALLVTEDLCGSGFLCLVLWHCCLVWWQESHLVCKNSSVGVLVVVIWLEPCTSFPVGTTA